MTNNYIIVDGNKKDGIDSYLKNLSLLLKFIDKHNNDFFLDYLTGNMTINEKLLIFYYCTSDKVQKNFLELVKKYELLKELNNFRGQFVDLPSEEEFKSEVQLDSEDN